MRKNPVLHVEGFDELNAALRAVGDRATGILLRNAAEEGAKIIADEARRLAPRDTGALAEGIGLQPGRIQQGRAVFSVGYGKRQWYGRLVEYGTKFIAARPFLRPAFEAKAQAAREAVSDYLRRALRDVL